jgi:hypothetical protein
MGTKLTFHRSDVLDGGDLWQSAPVGRHIALKYPFSTIVAYITLSDVDDPLSACICCLATWQRAPNSTERVSPAQRFWLSDASNPSNRIECSWQARTGQSPVDTGGIVAGSTSGSAAWLLRIDSLTLDRATLKGKASSVENLFCFMSIIQELPRS